MIYLRNAESQQRGKWTWRKDSYEWEFAELYYQIDDGNLLIDETFNWLFKSYKIFI